MREVYERDTVLFKEMILKFEIEVVGMEGKFVDECKDLLFKVCVVKVLY